MKQPSVSRAEMLKSIAAVPAVALTAGLAATGTADAAGTGKGAKPQFKYQDKPGPGNHVCGGCQFFQKPNGCSIVAGNISPKGWCIAWAPQTKKK